MKTIQVPVWTCARCGHRWIARKTTGSPVECPRCKRRDWGRKAGR